MASGKLASWISAMMIATLPLTAIAVPLPAAAQKVHQFNIPASEPASAIHTLGVQAGIHILVSADDLKGRKLHLVAGTLSTDQALSDLLEGTGLGYRYVGARAVAIVASAAESPSGRSSEAQSAAPEAAPAAAAPVAGAPNVAPTETELNQVVVSGTRIIRNGYEAPTPVSVVTAENLKLDANADVTDTLIKMPQLAGSLLSYGSNVQDDYGGFAGLEIVNLRSIGTNRTLVLQDGQRLPASNNTGTVDTGLIPDALLQRVDIVTGGASAIYGSDAVSGVVNFVLDKNFTGLKGSVEGGMTTYGDGQNFKLTLTYGTPFADGRGHLLLSGEEMYNAGIGDCIASRTWCQIDDQTVANPAYASGNGQPQYLAAKGAGFSNGAPGGLITGGPLQGTYFGPGGQPGQLNYGLLTPGVIIGGDWRFTEIDNPTLGLNNDLSFSKSRQIFFSRVGYDVTDHVNIYAELQYGDVQVADENAASWNLGNLTVNSGNPFIPASVQAQMTAQGLGSFPLGTFNVDTGPLRIANGEHLSRYVVGASGDVDAFKTNWKWNAYAQLGINRVVAADYAVDEPNLANAINAVRDPTTGSIVCASTLNPALTPPGASPGCVPYNVMGIGVNTPNAINYVAQWGYGNQRFMQKVADADVTGEPFSTWAGPVSLAFGATYRNELGDGAQDPATANNPQFVGNYHVTAGEYSVIEGFAETVVPLAKDDIWAKSLDLNLAARATDYNISGYVTTWKFGVEYSIVDDFRIRATRSRDIRAPNLGDLFSGGSTGAGIIFDPAKGGEAVSVQGATVGNLKLEPEIADSSGVGIVFQPTFLPGFHASVDYYHIRINDAIGFEGSDQDEVNDCYFEHIAQICALLTRDASGNLIFIKDSEVNINHETHDGIDIEADYSKQLSAVVDSWNGTLGVRGLASYYLHDIAEALLGGVQQTYDGAGVNSAGLGIGYEGTGWVPRVQYTVTATYSNHPLLVALTARGFSAGVNSPYGIQCSANCPVTSGPYFTINSNHSPGELLWDIAATHNFLNDKLEAFVTVENLFDRAPPYIPGSQNEGPYYRGIGNDNYDTIGRNFHAGVRFKL